MVHLSTRNACCNGNVNTTLKWRRQIYNVFTTLILRHCTKLVSALRRTSNVDYALSYGKISKVLSQSCKGNQYRYHICLLCRVNVVISNSGHYFSFIL